MVFRRELRGVLWPSRRHLDFEHGLDTAIRKVRDALGDTALAAGYIETVRGRGYRFVHPVEHFGPAEPTECAAHRRGSNEDLLPEVQYLLSRRAPTALRRSLDLLEMATRAGPESADIYAHLSEARILAIDYGLTDEQAGVAAAHEAALRALELNPENALGHACRAFVLHRFDWEWAEAQTEYETALELDPSRALIHQWYGEHLSQSGRHDEALAAARQAVRLRPESSVHRAVRAWVSLNAGRSVQAKRESRELLKHEPRFYIAAVVLARALIQEGRFGDAAKASREAVRCSGVSPLAVASLAVAEAQGAEESAQASLDFLESPPSGTFVSPYFAAKVHTARRAFERALGLLEEAFARRSGWLTDLSVDRELDSLRSDSRFLQIAEKLGLAAAPTRCG